MSLQHIDTLIDKLRWEEADSSKHDKIRTLKLDEDEWQNVSTFLSLLAICTHNYSSLTYLMIWKHADNAQQAFLSEQVSTLHLAIPALEALHRAWSSRASRPKYAWFAPALDAACNKIDNYYEKTTESPAYIMAMSKCCLSIPATPLKYAQSSIQRKSCRILRSIGRRNFKTTCWNV